MKHTAEQNKPADHLAAPPRHAGQLFRLVRAAGCLPARPGGGVLLLGRDIGTQMI
jgi:hypothetical protein